MAADSAPDDKINAMLRSLRTSVSGGKTAGVKPGEWRRTEEERLTSVIREWSKQVPVSIAPHVKTGAPYVAKAAVFLLTLLPIVADLLSKALAFAETLPERVVYAGIGFAVCFFGGIFPATIAAAEAWRLCGGSEALECLKMLFREWKKVQAAVQAEDAQGSGPKGSALSSSVTPQEMIARKAKVVLATVEPEVVSQGVVSLYTGWIGVLAILKLKFAKTVTLGERIGGAVYSPVSKYEPLLEGLVPVEFQKWVPVVVRWFCKGVAVMLAWWFTRVVAAVHSAIRGGLLFGKCLVEILHEKKIVSFTPEQAWLDEAIGWAVALLGLVFQLSVGFGVPFPLVVLLWPIQMLEGFIVYSVSFH